MPNPCFKFKQFTVFHDKCAMKVGTDGSLLGAWAEVEGARRILDIGTGTGLVALMAAQRSKAEIVAVDVDEEAVEQARENVERSPWKGRIEVMRLDARALPGDWEGRFDSIVSNPPYFVEDVKSPSCRRNQARHADSLDSGSLLREVKKVLAPAGTFSVILPAVSASPFAAAALREGLYLSRQTWVCTKPDSEPKRVLMAFSADSSVQAEIRRLCVEVRPREYSPEFAALLRPFYLAL